MPAELQKLEGLLVLHDRWIRALRSWKESISAGTTIKGGAIPVIPTASAPSVGAITKWENQSGGVRSQGTVVIQNGDRTFGVTNIVDDPDVIGVLDEDGIAVGADGKIRHVGYQAVVLVQGNVAAGNYLRTSTTAGRAEDAGTIPTDGTFAIALTAYGGGGAGTVAAYVDTGLQFLASHDHSGGDGAQIDHGGLAGLGDDDHTQYIEDADISPAEGFVRKTGAGTYTAHKSNLGAAVAPGVNDDSAAGYSVGSRWIDTTADKEYVCLDASAGAAGWTETTGAGGGGPIAMDDLTDADTTTDPPVKNEALKWNGSLWVPAAYDYVFTFSIASFSDGEAALLLIGSGVWKAAGAIAFAATYNNGPPTSNQVDKSINGAAYAQMGEMDAPNYTAGDNTDAVDYPAAKDQYLRFRLQASDGVDADTEYETAIYFRNYRFWGVATKNSGFTEADIEGLAGSELSNSKTYSKSINAGVGEYIVIAYPTSYGTLSRFLFNGVECAMEAVETVSVTNSAGYTENYYVYASTLANLGNYTFQTNGTLTNWLYWGELNKASSYTEADVEGNYATQPGKVASNSISSRSMIVNCTAGEYTYIAYPARLGALTSIVIGGFESIVDFNVDSTTLSITNENGYAENCRVYVSQNPGFDDPTEMIVTI